MPPILGLRTIAYASPDIAAAKAWYTQVLGIAPYFDEPFYVGFNVGGYELGLNPDTSETPTGLGGTTAYWGVADCRAEFARLVGLGAVVHQEPRDVGGGILVASVLDPHGNVFGIIENPHFTVGG
jgi:predicted enzyme related to lactoylglutathione lyase